MSASRSKARPKSKAKSKPKARRPAGKAKAAKSARAPKKKPARAAKRAAPRKAAAVPKPPAPPPPWTPDLQGLNVVWYNVTDWERAKRFYGGTLGLPVSFALEEAGWIEYGGKEPPHLAINRVSPPETVQPGGAVAVFTCPDARAAVERLRQKGVRCDAVDEMPGMVILGTFYDPDGNKLQLAQSLVP